MADRPALLATGLSGLIGTRLAELCNSDYTFDQFSLAQGEDILKPASLEPRFAHSTATTLLHLAAFTDVAKAWQENNNSEGLAYQINVTGTKNIVDLCAKYHKRLILFSTDFVFSGDKSGSYTEQDPPDARDWYGQTKIKAEKLVSQLGAQACIVRLAYPFCRPFAAKPDLVQSLLGMLRQNTLYPQFTDKFITPTYVDDLALALKALITTQATGIYHAVGSQSLSHYDFARLVATTFGFPPEVVKPSLLADFEHHNPLARPYPHNLSLANAKICRLGQFFRPLDQALADLKKLA